MSKRKKFLIKITIIFLVYIFVVQPYIFPKLHFSMYREHTIINYFKYNKSDFEYVLNNIRNKGVSIIRMDDNYRIMFHGEYKNKSYDKQHLYKGDEELK